MNNDTNHHDEPLSYDERLRHAEERRAVRGEQDDAELIADLKHYEDEQRAKEQQ